jgi:hypothetical protein
MTPLTPRVVSCELQGRNEMRAIVHNIRFFSTACRPGVPQQFIFRFDTAVRALLE